MIRRVLLSLAVTVVAVPSVSAAVQYQFRQTRHSEVQGVPSMDITGRATIDGNRSRVEFTGGTGGYPAGTYFIATDGARIVTFVDPKSKSFSEVNTANTMAGVGAARISVSNVKSDVEKLPDHPTIAGFDTDHSRLTVTYEITMSFETIVLRQSVKTVIDKWTTTAFGEIIENFVANGVFRTGNAALDSVLDAETTKVKGLPLRQLSRVTTTIENGRAANSKLTLSPTRNQVSEYMVTDIHATAVPASTFLVPAGFRKTEGGVVPAEPPVTNVTLQPAGK
jgi:hypothetical protein